MWYWNVLPEPPAQPHNLLEVHGVGRCVVCGWISETTEHMHWHLIEGFDDLSIHPEAVFA